MPSAEVWLICGRFRPDGLQDCLEHMGERGAVRWNLSESYNALKPCGRGHQAQAHSGTFKCKAAKPGRPARQCLRRRVEGASNTHFRLGLMLAPGLSVL